MGRFLFIFFSCLSCIESISQCTIQTAEYFPTPYISKLEDYGAAIAVSDRYLVVGAASSDSLEFHSGIVYVYELGLDEQWRKIAELVPSIPLRHLGFGQQISIYKNTIAVLAIAYTDDLGVSASTNQIYIYEKDVTNKWTSGTESYLVEGTQGTRALRLYENELITVTYEDGKAFIKVFKNSSGKFILDQTIPIPPNYYGPAYEFKLLISNELLIIGSYQFSFDNQSIGAVLLYERNASGYTSSPVAILKASPVATGYQPALAKSIAYEDNSILVTATLQLDQTRSKSYVYVYTKPVTGWRNMTETGKFEIGELTDFYPTLTVHQSYLLIGGAGSDVQVLKKTGSNWLGGTESFALKKPVEGVLFGRQIEWIADHWLIGAPHSNKYEFKKNEMIVDYYSPSNNFSSTHPINQKLQEKKINASGDFFGSSMAVFENYLVVGAESDNELTIENGAVYIYNTDLPSSTKPNKLFSPEPQYKGHFGRALAVSDSLLFVSAVYQDSISKDGLISQFRIGKVYVFELTGIGWEYKYHLVAPVVKQDQNFGQFVSYYKGYLAVSEFQDNTSENYGRVHIYKKKAQNRFSFLATLKSSEDMRGATFGREILMNDSLLVVGTGNGEFSSQDRLKVFVFKKKGEWRNATEDARLVPADSRIYCLFGFSIAMYGDNIVVGSPRYPGINTTTIPATLPAQGTAYIFERPPGGWKGTINESAQLFPSDPTDKNYFGYSVGIEYDDIFIGAPHSIITTTSVANNQSNRMRYGKVYHYSRTGSKWVSTNQEKRQLQSFDPDWRDGYGYKLLISDRYLYTSSLLDDNNTGFESGSVQTIMQLPLIKNVSPLCDNIALTKFKAFPRGGVWNGSGVDPSSGVFSPSALGAGLHRISYTVSGCQTEVSFDVVSFGLQEFERSAGEQSKCFYNSVPIYYITNMPQEEYSWYYSADPVGGYHKIATQKNQVIAEQPGYYLASISHGVCSVSREFKVVDEARIEIKITPAKIVCSDEPYQIAFLPTGGKWSGEATSNNGLLDPSQLTNGVKSYLYTYTTPLGCIFTKPAQIQIDKLIVPGIRYDAGEMCTGSSMLLYLTDVDDRTSIQWFQAGVVGSVGKNAIDLEIRQPGTYFAELSKYGCKASSPPATIIAKRDSLFVPNIVTLNNDGFNDYFQVLGTDLNNFRIHILNRYGQLMFEANDPGFKWNPANISTGVYYWRVTYTNCSGENKEQKGWLHLVR